MLKRKQPPPIAETAEIILALDRSGKPLPLREQPAYAAKMAEIARAAGVRDRARQRDERARARRLNPPPSRGAIERMTDLAAGAFIPGVDPAYEQQAAREEATIARAAEAALHGELAEIASELSYQYSLRLVAENRAAMVALYDHLCETAAALAGVQALHVNMLALGYQPNASILPAYFAECGVPDRQGRRPKFAAGDAAALARRSGMDLMTLTLDDDVLARLIGEAQAKLAAALAERPALQAESQATRRAHEDADNLFQNFVRRVNLAARRGADLVAPAVRQLLDDQRGKRDVVAVAATVARLRLENCDWAIGCARADLAQLELMRTPPTTPIYQPAVEIIKRPEPAWLKDFDAIEWPAAGAKPAAEQQPA